MASGKELNAKTALELKLDSCVRPKRRRVKARLALPVLNTYPGVNGVGWVVH